MLTRFLLIMSAVIGTLSFTACDDNTPKDNQTSGYISISVDETYKPVMEEQLKVFTSRFPNAHIAVEYKSESDCIKDFLEDTTRVIFVTRELTEEEKKYALSKQIVSKSLPMARDAIAFITAATNTNPSFKYNQIKDILTGNDPNNKYQIVFDHQGSSTVRYIQDSVLKGAALSSNVFATKGSMEVIDYVSQNDKAIGVIGVNWVADHKDSATESFLKQIQVAGILPPYDSANEYIKPYQAYIGLKSYPFTRNFYFISKETWPGLGTGLVNFLCRDGQLIFKQAKFFPLQVNVFLRETNVQQ